MTSRLLIAGALLAQQTKSVEALKLEAWQIALIVIGSLAALCLLLIILRGKSSDSAEDKPE